MRRIYKGLVPVIRFPDYKGNWEIEKLVELSNGGFCNGVFNDPKKIGSGYRLINVKDMYEGSCINIDALSLLELSEKEFKKNKVKYGDIFFTRSSIVPAGIAYSNVNLSDRNDLTFDGHLMKMSPDWEKVEPVFLFYNFSTFRSRKQFIARGKVSTMTTIGQEDIAPVLVPYPCIQEQQKIANFLSLVDKKIQQLAEKQSLLQQYKKGIMQKLFSQEIRFKDEQGNNFPDWKDKVVGDFMKESRVKGSGGDKAKKITVKLWGKGVYEKNEKNSGSENTQYYKRKSGQFIYSKLDFLNCAFGIIPEYLDEFETTVDLPCFDVEKSISKYFVLEYIKQKRFYKKFGDMADGSRKAKRIHADTFLGFPINLPSTKEQNKIASFLGALDKKIDFTNQQIEQTQTFKKGLLQQMFV